MYIEEMLYAGSNLDRARAIFCQHGRTPTAHSAHHPPALARAERMAEL
jgi:hypothetical protein